MVILYAIEDYTIYVGLDQFENEDLIKFSGRFMQLSGLVLMWFHADQFSSPHAYIRLHEGEQTPPPSLIGMACQSSRTVRLRARRSRRAMSSGRPRATWPSTRG
jgi:hypothetical protein